MCGIIAIVRGRTHRPPPGAGEILNVLEPVPARLEEAAGRGGIDETLRRELDRAADEVGAVDKLLRGAAGVQALVADRSLLATVDNLVSGLTHQVERIEARLDAEAGTALPGLEAVNAALIRLKDAVWAVARDRLRTARAVEDLAGRNPSPAAVAGYLSVQQALSALDRLEVRGRDSAGLNLLVRGHGLDLASPALAHVLADRGDDALFGAGAVRAPAGMLSFVYKAAAEIGELGDNTLALRDQIRRDTLLSQAMAGPDAEVVVLGHTRWASVGIISQPNAHPLNSEEVDAVDGPYVTGVLNGDVDNFADLKATEGLRIATEITTDAKVIPTLVSRRLAAGKDLIESFRETVNELEGSVAIGASSAAAPDKLLLALRGSGQALYIGLAEDAYVVASEPYGVVEDTDTYLRMDGETPSDPTNPATRGQIVVLDAHATGTVEGIARFAYDGAELPVKAEDLAVASVTTRDIDRGDAPHFLLKEIGEAPSSFRKTLRGKLVEGADGGLDVVLPDETLPADVRAGLRDGSIRRLLVVGQGTAAVAGHSLVVALAAAAETGLLQVEAKLATELSGFSLREDMSDTLVVAVSQSGTTTDTNRTVDLVRARGGKVVAIVNRRNSDLTDKADGVLYTSDGRDVEMSVASTKAFYSQIAACFLLGNAILAELAPERRGADDQAARDDRAAVLAALRDLPAAMERTIELRPQIAAAARELAPSRRYWAVVGNGVNRIAAHEVRIKLSELCYKSIACDATEDKKHIDLSSEPLILVCAAGLEGSTADDVAKEVAIYRAHKAAPIVFATEGEERYSAALQTILVPRTHPSLAFVLSAMVGHLFGYEAALAIDALARPLRAARGAIEAAITETRGHAGVTESGAGESGGHTGAGDSGVNAGAGESGMHARAAESGVFDSDAVLDHLQPRLEPAAAQFFGHLRSSDYNGHLEASTAVRVASQLRFALRTLPLEAYEIEYGRHGSPSVVIEDLTSALTRAIEELTRPVDAIKHQAKTVTVGISRSDETLLQVGLVKEVLATGVARDRLSYDSLKTLAALDPIIDEIRGYTRYRIEGRVDAPGEGSVTVSIIDRGGIARDLGSRTEGNPVLRGTKHRVAIERVVTLAKGRSDGRTFFIVPEVKDKRTVGLTLVHVTLRPDLPLTSLRSVLQGYRNRYNALRDIVMETEPTFRDDVLGTIPVVELMTTPLYDLADYWRS
jgi:glucosamine--fructose-6-phosphate aminotransferase (isomerizing)